MSLSLSLSLAVSILASSTGTNILLLIQSLRWICETRRLSSQLIHSQAGNIGVTCIIKDE